MRIAFDQCPTRSNADVDKSSCKWHGKAAAGHALKLACETGKRITKLGLLLVEKVASYGPECFVIDRKLAGQITQNNGKHPHRGSVARVRRELAKQQILQCKRIYPAQRISKYSQRSSSHGCVRSRLNRKLGFRPPEPRAAPPPPLQARHGATGAIVPRQVVTAAHSSELEYFTRVAAPAVALATTRELARESREDAAMLASVHHVRGPP
jgi:hypothetical protein